MLRNKLFACISLTLMLACNPFDCQAAIFTVETFTGNIRRYEDGTLQTTAQPFANISSGGYLSGITYGSGNLYVSDLFGSVYEFNATTGAAGRTFDTSANGGGPAGLAIGPDGRLYVSSLGNSTTSVFALDLSSANPSFNSYFSFSGPFSPLVGAAGGIGFAGNDLLVSTLGGGTYRYDGANTTPFLTSGFTLETGASAQIAVASSGEIFVGSSDVTGFGAGPTDANNVYRFGSNGIELGSISISLPAPTGSGTPSSPFTSPAGVAFDGNGNLIVGALGRTSPFNPADTGLGPNGALFLLDPNNNFATLNSLTNIAQISGVAFVPTAVPEPGTLAVLSLGAVGAFIARRRNQAKASEKCGAIT